MLSQSAYTETHGHKHSLDDPPSKTGVFLPEKNLQETEIRQLDVVVGAVCEHVGHRLEHTKCFDPALKKELKGEDTGNGVLAAWKGLSLGGCVASCLFRGLLWRYLFEIQTNVDAGFALEVGARNIV